MTLSYIFFWVSPLLLEYFYHLASTQPILMVLPKQTICSACETKRRLLTRAQWWIAVSQFSFNFSWSQSLLEAKHTAHNCFLINFRKVYKIIHIYLCNLKKVLTYFFLYWWNDTHQNITVIAKTAFLRFSGIA